MTANIKNAENLSCISFARGTRASLNLDVLPQGRHVTKLQRRKQYLQPLCWLHLPPESSEIIYLVKLFN